MDLSPSLEKAKLGERGTGRTRRSRKKKKKRSDAARRRSRSSRKSSDSPARRGDQKIEPKGVPHDLFAAMIAIGSERGSQSRVAARKIISGMAASSTNDSYMSILNWEAVVPFSTPLPPGRLLQKASQIFAFALIVLTPFRASFFLS